jgi:hypothetical protein
LIADDLIDLPFTWEYADLYIVSQQPMTEGGLMLMLPKLNKGMKRAMTRLEKASSKIVVSVALVVGLSTVGIHSTEAQAGIATPTVAAVSQSSMLLTPASGARLIVADHESHYSHSSHVSHASHASHYSSRY